MILIDTHSHIYLEQFDKDRNEAINRSIESGIKKILLPDIDSSTRNKMFQVSNLYPEICLPMLGIHPTSVRSNYLEEINLLKQSLKKNKVYAIGECGLDYYWDKTFVVEQKYTLVEQFHLANIYQLPLVVHSRKSLNDIINLLKDFKSYNLTGVFHCFPGGINEAKYLIEKGFYIGVGGVVTYKNSNLAEVVNYIPLESIVLETDAPYLPPIPHRGKRNESSFLIHIAQKIAEIKQIKVDVVAEKTTYNAKKLFKIDIYE